MLDGKKSVAFKVFYDALEIVEEKKQDEEKSSLELWKEALSNVMPHVEVRSRRVGGATFQIPMPIRADRKISMGIKWLISYARKRNEKSMAQRLAGEVLAAVKELYADPHIQFDETEHSRKITIDPEDSTATVHSLTTVYYIRPEEKIESFSSSETVFGIVDESIKILRTTNELYSKEQFETILKKIDAN
jgi:ribosomal protein S7